jgi:hypothetical protein
MGPHWLLGWAAEGVVGGGSPRPEGREDGGQAAQQGGKAGSVCAAWW